PVINMLYEQLSHYKKNPIKQNDPVIINAKGILESDNDTIEVLESVWNTFKDHSAFTLSDWSHRQGAAWDKAYNVENGKNILAYEISHDLIMEEFDDIIISPKRSREKRPGIQ
ncbi:type II toxin-antitoxin system antitoxin SocA domain-containing protein, partial [Fangia hongkongensis]